MPQPTAQISITADGNLKYNAALEGRCRGSCIDYSQMVKHLEPVDYRDQGINL